MSNLHRNPMQTRCERILLGITIATLNILCEPTACPAEPAIAADAKHVKVYASPAVSAAGPQITASGHG